MDVQPPMPKELPQSVHNASVAIPHVGVNDPLAIEKNNEPTTEASRLDKRNKVLFLLGSIGACVCIFSTLGVAFLWLRTMQ